MSEFNLNYLCLTWKIIYGNFFRSGGSSSSRNSCFSAARIASNISGDSVQILVPKTIKNIYQTYKVNKF